MKKLLSVLSVVAVFGVVGAASAADHSGQFGIGYQQTFTGAGLGTTLGSWSAKYGVTSNITAQVVFGMDMINKGGNNQANFGGRLLYDLVENENSDFYTGVGFLYQLDKKTAVTGGDASVLRIQLPLGWEWSFAGLPEIGFSVEAGVVWDYTTGGKQSQIKTVGGDFGFGAHYYF